MSYKTDQEKFWAGQFGDDYINRNQSEQLLASNINFFSKSLNNASRPNSVMEFGANIGMNLKALNYLYPEAEKLAIEINSSAAKKLEEVIPKENVFNTSIVDYKVERKFDLCLVKGVLIHINPRELEKTYKKLVDSTNKYLLVAEYYNPSPVVVEYRGYTDKLFKRDFAGEIMEQHPEMKLVDYGFVYHRDLSFPQDDVTWFLLEKK